MTARGYWMVQYQRSQGGRYLFRLADTEADARGAVEKLEADGFRAAFWEL